MSKRPEIAPENCPEPFWHETHRYCPVCTWTAAQEEPQRKEAVRRLERIKGCHRPSSRLPDSCILDGEPWPCERGWLVAEVERLRGVVERAQEVVASVSELGCSYREMPGMNFVNPKYVQRLVASLAALEGKDG